LLGCLGYSLALPGVTFRGITFDAHSLLFSSLAILLGYQSIIFAFFAKIFAISEGLLPEDKRLSRFFEYVSLERGLMLAFSALFTGIVLLLVAINQWRLAGFGRLDYAQTMRWVVPGVTLTCLGWQTILSSFFVSLLRMRHR
jgi:hypothetical protein